MLADLGLLYLLRSVCPNTYGEYGMLTTNPVSILYKSTAGRYRPVRVADGPITARCRFIKNASWVNAVSTCAFAIYSE